MVSVELKGLYIVRAKGRTYYYAWRDGPAVKGEFGSPEFHASYNEAVAERTAPDTRKFRSVVVRYKASSDYKGLADSTKRNWGPWLDTIALVFGDARTASFGRTERARMTIRKWRGKIADERGLRAADYGMQVLSRVFAYAVDPLGELASNPCEGIKQLYSSNRSDIIWTDTDIAHLKKTCSVEIGHAVDLAAHTGLRVGDLIRLSWSHVGEDAIVLTTGKSRHRREAVIPLYQELRDVLARIPRRSPVILTSSRGRPWVRDGLSSSFADAKKEAWPPDGTDLHFHDLRGTACTKFYLAGLDKRTIAEVMAWEEDNVERIIKRYVGRSAALKETIRKLNEARTRT
jgi:integrase